MIPRSVHDERGQISVFVVGAFLALWLFTGIVVDGGLALAGKVRAMDNAQKAARTAAQQLDLAALRKDGTVRLASRQAEAAADAYIAATGDTARVEVRGNSVTVHVRHTVRTQVLRLAGLHQLTASARATARAERGTPQERGTAP